jgi:ankyrin repeat protein
VKIVISARAAAYRSKTNQEITGPEELRQLDGVGQDNRSCCDHLGRGLNTTGLLAGGRLRLSFRPDAVGLRVVTEYDCRRALSPKELQKLVEVTTGQWSDGIGACASWHEVRPGVGVDVWPRVGDRGLQVEQTEADKAPRRRTSPLVKAVEEGDLDKINKLLARGEDVNARSKFGQTALAIAVQREHVAAALLLLERGADVHLQRDRGGGLGEKSLLHLACMDQHVSVGLLRVLVERGLDVNGRDDRGATPLMWAANRNHAEAIPFLLERGADVNLRDTHKYNEGQTALMYTPYPEILRLLLEYGADPNIREDRGQDAYEMALYQAKFMAGMTTGEHWQAAAELLLEAVRRRAEGGDAASQYTRAGYHERGVKGVPQDAQEAFQGYQRSAAGGYRLALVPLGRCHEEGKGTAADGAAALACYRRAADAGVPQAMAILGDRYATGKGVAADLAEAAGWYRLGAQVKPTAQAQPNEVYDFRRGVAECRVKLGACCEDGKGVTVDCWEALKWYEGALDLGWVAAGPAVQRARRATKAWRARPFREQPEMRRPDTPPGAAGG